MDDEFQPAVDRDILMLCCLDGWVSTRSTFAWCRPFSLQLGTARVTSLGFAKNRFFDMC